MARQKPRSGGYVVNLHRYEKVTRPALVHAISRRFSRMFSLGLGARAGGPPSKLDRTASAAAAAEKPGLDRVASSAGGPAGSRPDPEGGGGGDGPGLQRGSSRLGRAASFMAGAFRMETSHVEVKCPPCLITLMKGGGTVTRRPLGGDSLYSQCAIAR